MAGLENLGISSGSIGFGNMASQAMVVMEWILYGLIVGGIIAFAYIWLQYKYDVLIIEPRSGQGIKGKREKARKIIKGPVVDYELRSSLLKKRMNKESFPADSAEQIPLGRKDLLVTYRVTSGAFHPVAFENPISADGGGKLHVQMNKDLIRGIIARIRQTVDKYNEQKWYNHPLFMASVFVIVSFIHLIMFLKLLETAGGVGGVCSDAATKIQGVTTQVLN